MGGGCADMLAYTATYTDQSCPYGRLLSYILYCIAGQDVSGKYQI